MKKGLFVLLMAIGVSSITNAQAVALVTKPVDTVKLYTPNADAVKEIAKAVKEAKKANKHVLIQAGGNWCSWCLLFNKTTTNDKQMDSAIHANYVVYHLNYSQENKNDAVFASYGYAQRFGFPVFLILDGNGKLLHTQNSSYLEEGKGYNKRKVIDFFNDWRPGALDPKNYATK